MAGSTPSAMLSSHRPVILFLAGAAAASTAYLIYTRLYGPAPKGDLHRTQTIRRPNRRTRGRVGRAVPQRGPVSPGPREFNFFGQLLGLDHIPPREELESLARQLDPAATPETIGRVIDQLQDAFLDSIFANIVTTDPSELRQSVDIDLSALPETSIQRAIQRRAARISEQDTGSPETSQSTDGQPSPGMPSAEAPPPQHALPTEAQALQEAIYHVAAERANMESVIHRGVVCSRCGIVPRGIRWHCANCVDFDLCHDCEATADHNMTHIFYKIKIPAPFLALPPQEPIYPGKPDQIPEHVHHTVKQYLENETDLSRERIDALWKQFRCLAATKWDSDPYDIGWGIDRETFNRTFLPQYPGFATKENLLFNRLFAFYDSDSNGIIGFVEFVKGLDAFYNKDGRHLGNNGQQPEPTNKRLENVFKLYDADNDGYIFRRDILRIFRAHYAIQKAAIRNKLANDGKLREKLDDFDKNISLSAIYQPQTPLNPEVPDLSTPATPRGPVLLENKDDTMQRSEALRQGFTGRGLDGDEEIKERHRRREFYLDEEEGLVLPEDLRDPEVFSGNARVDLLYRDILYQQLQQAFNQLLDQVFSKKEDRVLRLSVAAEMQSDPALQISPSYLDAAISFDEFKQEYDKGLKFLDVWSDLVQF